MTKNNQLPFRKKLIINLTGFGLIIIAPFLGWLPGPGGIPIFLAGIAILARNYKWAEDLLQDFDNKRIYFIDKFLLRGRKISLLIDIICIILITIAIITYILINNSYTKFIPLGLASFFLFILLSNQKRLDKIINKFRR